MCMRSVSEWTALCVCGTWRVYTEFGVCEKESVGVRASVCSGACM